METENKIRVYCKQFPDYFEFQIRTNGPITESGKGKDRRMLASVGISIEEMKSILKYMETEKDRKDVRPDLYLEKKYATIFELK